ncbi:hypothetical protein [uncultured Alistipes sp.]|uniref:hypothetical protein n=1 Tax=uncultured Alistipes sp. TaxID=538949 RepID=UPI0025FD7B6F|nr:hypothetical protein [uncultured Alistipes sp.]
MSHPLPFAVLLLLPFFGMAQPLAETRLDTESRSIVTSIRNPGGGDSLLIAAPSPLYLEDECVVYLPDEEEQILDRRRFTFRTMKARKIFLAPDESITNRIPVGDLLDHSPQKDCRAAALLVRYKSQWLVAGSRRSGMFYEYKRVPL